MFGLVLFLVGLLLLLFGLIFIVVTLSPFFWLIKGLRIMFGGLELFLEWCYIHNIFKKNRIQQLVIGG